MSNFCSSYIDVRKFSKVGAPKGKRRYDRRVTRDLWMSSNLLGISRTFECLFLQATKPFRHGFSNWLLLFFPGVGCPKVSSHKVSGWFRFPNPNKSTLVTGFSSAIGIGGSESRLVSGAEKSHGVPRCADSFGHGYPRKYRPTFLGDIFSGKKGPWFPITYRFDWLVMRKQKTHENPTSFQSAQDMRFESFSGPEPSELPPWMVGKTLEVLKQVF